MLAAQDNIEIEQGADFEFVFELVDEDSGVPINLSGCSLRAQLRLTAGGPLVKEFETEIASPTEGAGRFFLSAADTLTIEVGVSNLAGRTLTPMAYDCLLIFPSGVIWRLVEGIATISPVVTQDEPEEE